MAVFDVFTQQVSYRYKSTVCSKATIILVIFSIFTVILPLIISYRSNGFWLKTDVYLEQPDVTFTHDYLLVIQTNFPHAPVHCRAQFSVTDIVQRHCVFKSYQEDVNRDGKVDHLSVEVKVPLLKNESVYSVTLILTTDFRISDVCRFRMQSLLPVQHISALPGASLHVAADLRFIQKKPVDYRKVESLFSSSFLTEDLSLKDIFFMYAQRNFSTNLMNQYDVWTTGREVESPFLISLKVNVPESTILYRPGFWQVVKWAWMQYSAFFIVFVYFSRVLKEYIFSNQMVPTYKSIPWKRYY